MCDIVQKAKKVKGGIDLDVLCKKTGLPITETNEYGMFCKRFCDLAANKRAKKDVEKLMSDLVGLPPFDGGKAIPRGR